MEITLEQDYTQEELDAHDGLDYFMEERLTQDFNELYPNATINSTSGGTSYNEDGTYKFTLNVTYEL